MSLQKSFTASIHKEGEIFVASCLEIGTVSQGSSIEDAIKNLKETTELYLEEFPHPNFSQSYITTFLTGLNA